jgi:hypothetical protein
MQTCACSTPKPARLVVRFTAHSVACCHMCGADLRSWAAAGREAASCCWQLPAAGGRAMKPHRMIRCYEGREMIPDIHRQGSEMEQWWCMAVLSCSDDQMLLYLQL